MSGIATAIVGSAVIGGYASSQASKEGAKSSAAGMAAEERMAERNIEFQREMAEQQREDFAPWRDTGQQALDRIWSGVQSGEFEVGDIDVTKDPGYQFRMQEGVEALDASASARGRLLSGAQQKSLTKYGQDVGSQEYANAYARESNKLAKRYNILSSLSAGGQASAAGQAQSAGQLAESAGNIMATTGRAQNVGIQQAGAARAGAYTDTAQSINQAAQNWLTYKGINNTGAGGSSRAGEVSANYPNSYAAYA